MYSTRTRVHACIPTDILARKSVRRTKVRGQVGEDRRACPARGELNGPRAPRRLPREDTRAEVGEGIRVGVGVREFKLMYIKGKCKWL